MGGTRRSAVIRVPRRLAMRTHIQVRSTHTHMRPDVDSDINQTKHASPSPSHCCPGGYQVHHPQRNFPVLRNQPFARLTVDACALGLTHHPSGGHGSVYLGLYPQMHAKVLSLPPVVGMDGHGESLPESPFRKRASLKRTTATIFGTVSSYGGTFYHLFLSSALLLHRPPRASTRRNTHHPSSWGSYRGSRPFLQCLSLSARPRRRRGRQFRQGGRGEETGRQTGRLIRPAPGPATGPRPPPPGHIPFAVTGTP
jgi:hypothetical protein